MTQPEQNAQKWVQTFDSFKTWEEKYKHLMSLGKSLPPFPEDQKTEINRVKGCQSQVWLIASYENGKIHYKIESDALIVKGLAYILYDTFSGATPRAILDQGTDFLTSIGLTQHLSQSRSNGLSAMVRQFKNYAIAFMALEQQKLQ